MRDGDFVDSGNAREIRAESSFLAGSEIQRAADAGRPALTDGLLPLIRKLQRSRGVTHLVDRGLHA